MNLFYFQLYALEQCNLLVHVTLSIVVHDSVRSVRRVVELLLGYLQVICRKIFKIDMTLN